MITIFDYILLLGGIWERCVRTASKWASACNIGLWSPLPGRMLSWGINLTPESSTWPPQQYSWGHFSFLFLRPPNTVTERRLTRWRRSGLISSLKGVVDQSRFVGKDITQRQHSLRHSRGNGGMTPLCYTRGSCWVLGKPGRSNRPTVPGFVFHN